MTTMKTRHGHTIDFDTGVISKVDIRDIAHSLAMQVRFMGHTVLRYSVAYHSYLVSLYVSEEHALWGLLHDAEEAYIGDIIRPAQELLGEEFRQLQRFVRFQIAQEFGLPPKIPEAVLEVDNRLLVAEMRSSLIYDHPDVVPLGAEGVEPLSVVFTPENDWLAGYQVFMNRYEELTRGSNT